MLASVRAEANWPRPRRNREEFDKLSPDEQRAERLADFDRLVVKELASITDETESWPLQAKRLAAPGNHVVVVTTNVRHLARFIETLDWDATD